MTVGEVNLKGIFTRFGQNQADAGKYFGWKPSFIVKSTADFTKEELLARGWTKDRLAAIAEAYEHIASITPKNPSAAGRAAQLRQILARFFPN